VDSRQPTQHPLAALIGGVQYLGARLQIEGHGHGAEIGRHLQLELATDHHGAVLGGAGLELDPGVAPPGTQGLDLLGQQAGDSRAVVDEEPVGAVVSVTHGSTKSNDGLVDQSLQVTFDG